MKATGVVRRIDDLGRIVVPKEIRKTLRIREGDPLEIFTDKEGEIILKKYSPIGELSEFASQYAETLSKTTGHIACISDKDTIIAVLNTVYPGIRNEKGDLRNVLQLFRGWTSYLWTTIEINNPCEEVDFLSLFPLGAILSIFVLYKQKEKDVLLKWLMICNVFLICFLLLHMPEWLTSITMMRNVTAGRGVIAIGYLNLIILIRTLSKIKWEKTIAYYLFIPGIFSVLLGTFTVEAYLNNAQKLIVIFVGLLQIAFLLMFCKEKQNGFIVLMLSLSIIGGAFVNPINTGLDSIFETEIYKEIESINSKDKELWAVVNGGIILNNLPAVAGAHTMNAVSTYPDCVLWEELGMKDKEEIWNRYAHKNIQISDEKDIKLLNPDALEIYVDLKTLKELGVQYILSRGELPENNDCVELFEYSNIWIYSFR